MSRIRTGLAALALGLVAGVGLAPQANAAFTTPQCQGADVTGRGASFANAAHFAWELNFGVFCGGGDVPDITYDPAGSGGGRTAMTQRPPVATARFGGTDDPLTASQKQTIEAGVADNPNDDGVLHQVPAAVGAVSVLVNWPNDCNAELLSDAHRTEAGGPVNQIRARFDKQTLEAIFARESDADNWTEVFPELSSDADCDKPIVRVVRFDASGTTFAFKDYLSRENPSRNWLTTYQSPTNILWPNVAGGGNTTVGARADCGGATGPGTPDGSGDQLTSGCANGAENLVAKMLQVDGSIGYADIASARPSFAVNTITGTTPPDKYWTQIQNGNDSWTEPTADPNGYKTTGNRGANCTTTQFVNVGETTLGDWSQTSGVDSPTGYGICTLTYGMLFDDHAGVYGVSAEEEALARTVKDYWTSILSDLGQTLLTLNDYAPLPAGILAKSRTGVSAIDWNKGAGGGGGNNGGGNDNGGGDNGGGNNTPTPPPAKPSNQFSVPKTAISSKTGSATVSVKLPGKGRLELVGNAKSGKKTIRVGRVVLTANKAGTFKLTLKPGKAAKALLKSKGRLKVALKLTYTPTGGSAKSSTRTVTLKLSKPKKKSGRR